MRTIASDIARIFDPLGLLNPVIAHGKIIQQELWRLKLDWDDSVPQEICTKWQDFVSQLTLLNDLSFQRHVSVLNAKHIELHGFSDASERAYGACIYLLTVDMDGNKNVQLWFAKSRITPLKSSQTSAPRLELCAAELLTDIYTSLKKATDINPDKWRHIRTHDNPADAISRGQLPIDFTKNLLWRNGPEWITGGENTWPYTPIEVAAEVPDVKKTVCLTSSTKPRSSQSSTKVPTSENFLLSRFSCYHKLRRFVALVLRWITICKRRRTADHQQLGQIRIFSRFLTVNELDAATTRILLLTQRATFSEEFKRLEAGEFVSKCSKLQHLNPFIDDNGLIRVGGRVEKAKTISFDERHPIVLPPFHHTTRLFITATHLDNFHAGC
ncbi:uncharacterized protein LOC122506774 [Leptopilina heterotoma]|uniref:uncharacterized protein LOC122506774 n=1 Tax=Leptopilina heterotoma TaxID=63436 RepID=UPI001CA95F12|nr:uncharacterized protein LOC122506774 [Leptopilina heterotoma]